MPADADEDKVTATHKNGVPSIRIAKSKPEAAKAKSIKINRG